MSELIKCPECGSVEIEAEVLAHGYTRVDLQTGELTEDPMDCDYDVSDIDEFICGECHHKWDGKMPDHIYDVWASKRSVYWSMINDKYGCSDFLCEDEVDSEIPGIKINLKGMGAIKYELR